MPRRLWTIYWIAGFLLGELIIHICFLLSLLRGSHAGYPFFQSLGLLVIVGALLGLHLGFLRAPRSSLRESMAWSLPAGLAGGAIGLGLFALLVGFPTSVDVAFTIWVLVFCGAFGLFLLARQLYRARQK